jgi:hypothetical protein
MKRMKNTIFIVMLLLCLNTLAGAQNRDDSLFVDIDEPSWIYRGRGDRYYYNGDYGNAIVQYKKALIKRDMEFVFTKLDGLDIQKGLKRNTVDIDGYGRLLFLFRTTYKDDVSPIHESLNNNRLTHALDITTSLKEDAHAIGADGVAAEAQVLEEAIITRNTESWEYLLNNLSRALNRVILSLNQLNVDYGGQGGNQEEPKLVLNIEGEGIYPEVNLKLARIYSMEGLYDLALKQLENVEEGKESLQIPDHIYDAMYTRAEIYRTMKKMTQYLEELENIIEMDVNWEGRGNFKGYKERQLHRIPDSAIVKMNEDAVSRSKFGRAYFEYGSEKYMNGNYEKAEPYLKMAFLYNYEREQSREYLLQCYSLGYKKADMRKLKELGELTR